MAVVFCTGFEHGVSNLASLIKGNAGAKYADVDNGSPTMVTTVPRTGTYCLEIATTAGAEGFGWDANSLGTLGSVMVVGFAIYFPTSLPTTDIVLAQVVTTSSTIDLNFSFRNSDSKLFWNTSTGSGTPIGSTNAVTTNTWYWIDFRFTISGTSWTVTWAIDTVAQTNFTHTAPTTDTHTRFDIGPRSGTPTVTLRYDDVVVSTTSGDYPLGKHEVQMLIPDTGGTTAEIGTANATSRMVTNSALDATHNSAQILTAISEVPPLIGGTATGVGQRTAGVGNAVGIPMTSYTLASGETISAVRILVVGWSATTTANEVQLRTFNGTTETVLQGAVDPNFDADTASPGWLCKMATLADFNTQAELDAMVIRYGYSTDISPLIGAHVIYAEVAVKEAIAVTGLPILIMQPRLGAV